jgi:hypothetical protein
MGRDTVPICRALSERGIWWRLALETVITAQGAGRRSMMGESEKEMDRDCGEVGEVSVKEDALGDALHLGDGGALGVLVVSHHSLSTTSNTNTLTPLLPIFSAMPNTPLVTPTPTYVGT